MPLCSCPPVSFSVLLPFSLSVAVVPLCSCPAVFSLSVILPVFIAVALPLCSCPAYFSVILPIFIAAALPLRSCPAYFSVSVILPVFIATTAAVIAASPTTRFAIAAPLPYCFSTCPRWTNADKMYEHMLGRSAAGRRRAHLCVPSGDAVFHSCG